MESEGKAKGKTREKGREREENEIKFVSFLRNLSKLKVYKEPFSRHGVKFQTLIFMLAIIYETTKKNTAINSKFATAI